MQAHPGLSKKFLKSTGIKTGEFAFVMGVSRQTVSYWIHGHTYPYYDLKAELDTVMAALQSAASKGDLPLKGVARKGRKDALRQIIALHQAPIVE